MANPHNGSFPQVRISNKTLNLIAQLERRQGALDMLTERNLINNDQESNKRNALAALALDVSTPTELSYPIVQFLKSSSHFEAVNQQELETEQGTNHPLSQSTIKALRAAEEIFKESFEFDEDHIIKINRLAASESELGEDCFRNTMSVFSTHSNKRVFTAVSPFLVRRRFTELVSWMKHAIQVKEMHPLVAISIFHLLFLQLQPFKTANHRTSLFLMWHLCKLHGYTHVAHSNIIGLLLVHSEDYYTNLKIAERSSFTDWRSLNAWIEFFLKAQLSATDEISVFHDDSKSISLSKTQEKILAVIQEWGTVSREKVVHETGMSASTVKYNLSLLAERGHLIREGAGRNTSYRLF